MLACPDIQLGSSFSLFTPKNCLLLILIAFESFLLLFSLREIKRMIITGNLTFMALHKI